MTDFIIVVVLLAIIGAAVVYIVKAKKSGVKCIGCPAGGECAHKNGASGCSGNCGGDGSCGCHTEAK